MTWILRILEWVERWTERVVGGVLVGLAHMVTFATRRGRYRRWRREQERRAAARARRP